MAYIKSVTATDNNTYDIKSKVTSAIPYGECDSTSTATAFTATVDGVDALYDGVTIMLRNGVITSASGFTIDINGLGAKPVYNNMATGNDITPTAPTRDTTIFNINYTMLLVYCSTLVDGGAWICYRGYDANTNTIGYQLRTNSTAMKTAIRSRYYRIFFTSADDTHWEPANTGYDNSATSAKTVNTRPIDPFGRIVYTSANTNFTAESVVTATSIWDRYTLNLGYSFNRTGAALTLTYPAPVYVKCAPQTNGSAIIDSTTPIVQTLPSTADGKIYIYLGVAYSATNIELVDWHPIYYYADSAIRLWTNATSGSSVDPATATPLMDGTGAVGTSAKYAREDHVHPSDTNKQAALVSGTNIKTINNESILGSGNITISGGGVEITYATVNIATSDWSNNTCTKTVSGVTADSGVMVTYAPSSKAIYTAADIYCSAQATDSLTFSCTTTPTAAVTVNVMIIDGGTVAPTVVLDWSGTTNSSWSYQGSTSWIPTVGEQYEAHFTSDSPYAVDTGNVTLTAIERNDNIDLTPRPTHIGQSWYVEWQDGMSSNVKFWGFDEGETFHLTIYG